MTGNAASKRNSRHDLSSHALLAAPKVDARLQLTFLHIKMCFLSNILMSCLDFHDILYVPRFSTVVQLLFLICIAYSRIIPVGIFVPADTPTGSLVGGVATSEGARLWGVVAAWDSRRWAKQNFQEANPCEGLGDL